MPKSKKTKQFSKLNQFVPWGLFKTLSATSRKKHTGKRTAKFSGKMDVKENKGARTIPKTRSGPRLHQHASLKHATARRTKRPQSEREIRVLVSAMHAWSAAYQLPHHAHGVVLAARQVLLSEPPPIGLYPVERRNQDEGVEVAGNGEVLAGLVEAVEHVYRRGGREAREEGRLLSGSTLARFRSTINDQPGIGPLFSVHTTTRTNTRHRRARRKPERRRGLELGVRVRGRRGRRGGG